MVEYDSASIYIQSSPALCDKIAKIDLIITALEDTALSSAANDNIEEYWLDDGQSKIKTTYKGTDLCSHSDSSTTLTTVPKQGKKPHLD